MASEMEPVSVKLRYDPLACAVLLERLRRMPKGGKKQQMHRQMRKVMGRGR